MTPTNNRGYLTRRPHVALPYVFCGPGIFLMLCRVCDAEKTRTVSIYSTLETSVQLSQESEIGRRADDFH